MTPETRDRILTDLTKQLADDGRLIEVGWIALMKSAIPPNAPPIQIREMRLAFMAGAQHLWSSIVTFLDPETHDGEPTEDDLRRVSLIAAELDRFREEMMRDVRFAAGFEAGPPS